MESHSISNLSNEIPDERPSNYLVLAIISTILCCTIVGVVSLYYAAQVNAKWEGGNYEGAINDSKNAKLWGIISMTLGAVLIGSIILLYGAMIIAAIAGGSGGY